MTDDAELLRRYAEENAEEAFAEFVRRNLGLVYHAALRQCGGDAHRAKDVAQTVFTDVARKARSLARRSALAGWLHTSTRYAAAQAVRGEVRRQRREREAHAMNEILAKANGDDAASAEWERMRPVIDEALYALPERDREAVLARFFEGKAFAEIGARLRLTEDAARMRVERALEKLRVALVKRGITSSTAAVLGVALANQAGAAVPAGLAASVTEAAVAGAVGGVTTTGKLISVITLKSVLVGVAVAVVGGVLLLWQSNRGAGSESKTARLSREPKSAEQRPVDNRSLPDEATALNERPKSPAAEPQKKPDNFSISGMVKRPGKYSIPPGGSVSLTLAIIQAGGLVESMANTKKIRVIRSQRDGTVKIFSLDLERSGDFAVEAGDLVYVPEKII